MLQALEYKQRVLDALPPGADFTPLMTLYLTDNTPVEEVHRAKEAGERMQPPLFLCAFLAHINSTVV